MVYVPILDTLERLLKNDSVLAEVIGIVSYVQGRTDPPKAGRGHTSCIYRGRNAKFKSKSDTL